MVISLEMGYSQYKTKMASYTFYVVLTHFLPKLII